MKEKIIARLKEKFPNINFSQARLDAIADKLKVKEESEIDGKLDELNEVFPFVDIAKQDDRIRGLDAKDKKKDAPKPDSAKPSEEPAKDEDVPAWAKGLTTLVQDLAGKVSAIETGKSTETRKSQLETALKDAPESHRTTIMKAFNRMDFKEDEDFTSYLEEVQSDLPAVIQESANSGLNGSRRPIVPTGGNNTKQASKEQVKEAVKHMA